MTCHRIPFLTPCRRLLCLGLLGMALTGCATIIMSPDEAVEVIQAPPSGAVLITELGTLHQIHSDTSKIFLPRSRYDVSAAITCNGITRPITLRTHVNFAFAIGNAFFTLTAPLAYMLDSLSDNAYNYRDALNLAFYCHPSFIPSSPSSPPS